MKRALAERAKQQSFEQHKQKRCFSSPIQVSMSSNISGYKHQYAPKCVEENTSQMHSYTNKTILKIPRKYLSNHSPIIKSNCSSRTSPVLSGSDTGNLMVRRQLKTPPLKSNTYPVLKSQKRRRSLPSIVTTSHHLDVTPWDNDELLTSECNPISTSSCFFLQNQNRALASELYSYKRSIVYLEKERKFRRRSCTEIGRALCKMGTLWIEAEVVIVECLKVFGNRQPEFISSLKSQVVNLNHTSFVPSTGTGLDVEATEFIIDSMKNLAYSSKLLNSPTSSSIDDYISPKKVDARGKKCDEVTMNSKIKQGEDMEDSFLLLLSKIINSFSQRSTTFQKLILQLVRSLVTSFPTFSSNDNIYRCKLLLDEIFRSAELKKEIYFLRAKCSELESKLYELTKARDDASDSERIVRRGLYRIASGRMKIEEVLKAVEKVGFSSRDDNTKLQERLLSYSDVVVPSDGSKTLLLDSNTADILNTSYTQHSESSTITLNGVKMGARDVILMKKKLEDLEEILKFRETMIAEMIRVQEKREKKINNLLFSNRRTNPDSKFTDEEVKLSPLYTEIKVRLATSEKESRDLKEELKLVKEGWAVAISDVQLARKCAENLQEKHNKRMKEIISEPVEIRNDLESSLVPEKSFDGKSNFFKFEKVTDAMKNIELEHKLRHALENVRQSESIRISLSESNTMNDALQSKLDELKSKNATLVANKAASRASLVDTSTFSHNIFRKASSSDQSKDTPSSSSIFSLKEKIHRMKKELSAAIVSKDQAKVKQERAEKERDALMKKNARLIKQSVEKDDMNAKSLSTIVHLKQLSEQFDHEKNILLQKLKGAEQLALAARLAANAKVRVDEEAIREKRVLQKEVEQVKSKVEYLQKENNDIKIHLYRMKTYALVAEEDLITMRERCDELVSLSSTYENEKKQLYESLVMVKKEALEAKRKVPITPLRHSPLNRSDESMFTTKQLTTQVDHLKSRLACPVCNTRDKQVILLRCRHMFCRQCVDKNIKNRSRKCPACAQRFDIKDVGDIWL